MFLKTIKKISELWPEYYANGTVNRQDYAYELIAKELPAELKAITPRNEHFKIKSSGGIGRITAAPWIATFDTRVTKSSQNGFYVVFLYSIDMKRIVLELGFGTNQFYKFYGDNLGTRDEIRRSAKYVQNVTADLLTYFPNQEFVSRLNLSESNLSTKLKHSLHIGYEKASIYSISYDIDSLDKSSLLADYQSFLKLYQVIVESQLVPPAMELFEKNLNVNKALDKIKSPEVSTFISAKRKTGKKHIGTEEHRGNYRYSANSKKVGDMGELVVFNYELSKLENASRLDLIPNVIHEELLNNRPGWDISSFSVDGEPMKIEVKASIGDTINCITLTKNEWAAANEHQDNFYLYLVTSLQLNKVPKIQIIKNPAKLLHEEKFQIEIASYNLRLFS